jgi:hypothetical protein
MSLFAKAGNDSQIARIGSWGLVPSKTGVRRRLERPTSKRRGVCVVAMKKIAGSGQ